MSNFKKEIEAKINNTGTTDNINVGDVYLGTFGYSMTIPVGYQVVRKTKKCIFIRELNIERTGDGWTGNAKPIPNDFRYEKVIKCVIKEGCDYIFPEKKVFCRKWDGQKTVSYNSLD